MLEALPSGMWSRTVLYKFIDVSEEYIESILSAEE
jgi:hypothetical protein